MSNEIKDSKTKLALLLILSLSARERAGEGKRERERILWRERGDGSLPLWHLAKGHATALVVILLFFLFPAHEREHAVTGAMAALLKMLRLKSGRRASSSSSSVCKHKSE